MYTISRAPEPDDRHIPDPDNADRTLCGRPSVLPSEYTDSDGKLHQPDSWMVADLPPCATCDKKAARRTAKPDEANTTS